MTCSSSLSPIPLCCARLGRGVLLGLLLLWHPGLSGADEAAQHSASPASTSVQDSLRRDAERDTSAAPINVPRTLVEDGSRTLMKAPQAATEQTVDAVLWLAKRRQLTVSGVPYGVTGLPIFYYSRHTGWNYGARIQWADYRRLPYRYKATLHTLRSSKSRSDTYFRLKVPRISDTGFGLLLLISDKRDIRARYYGRGNDTHPVAAYSDPQSPQFLDACYYYYVLEEPRFILMLLRHLRGPVGVSLVLGAERARVSPRGERSYYVDEGTPDGVRDGGTGFVGATLTWDSRDDDTIPKRGVFHEWSYETSRNSVLGLFFEEIDFRRYTFTDTRYFPLTPRLNLAHRTVCELLTGQVPLYAYGEIGGRRRIKGLGGGDSLRGYDTQRFTDNVRLFTNTELRYHLRSSRLFRQYLEWHGVIYVDTGRVWPDLDSLTLRGLHVSGGLGLRIYWNADFVIRLGLAVSAEQIYTPIKYRNIF